MAATPPAALAPLWEKARAGLLANVESLPGGPVLTAGATHFHSAWTRDFCHAVPGLLAAGRADVVRAHLERLFASARPEDGLLPRVLDSQNPKLRVALGMVRRHLPFQRPPRLREPLHPEYIDEKGQVHIDGNLLAVRAALQYVDATGDRAFWERNKPALVRIFGFYERHLDSDGLVVQPPFSDWQDSVRREGKTFLTNLLYLKTAERLADDPDFGLSSDALETLSRRLRETFFDEESGLFRSVEGEPYVSLEGNLFALDEGYVSPDSTSGQALWRALKKSPLWTLDGLPGRASHPDYPRSWRSLPVRLVGLGHYHDQLSWSWLMGQAAKVADRVGDREESGRILQELARLAERDGHLGEIYRGTSREPFETLRYRSEAPFSWGSGKVLEALALHEGVTSAKVTPDAWEG